MPPSNIHTVLEYLNEKKYTVSTLIIELLSSKANGNIEKQKNELVQSLPTILRLAQKTPEVQTWAQDLVLSLLQAEVQYLASPSGGLQWNASNATIDKVEGWKLSLVTDLISVAAPTLVSFLAVLLNANNLSRRVGVSTSSQDWSDEEVESESSDNDAPDSKRERNAAIRQARLVRIVSRSRRVFKY